MNIKSLSRNNKELFLHYISEDYKWVIVSEYPEKKGLYKLSIAEANITVEELQKIKGRTL